MNKSLINSFLAYTNTKKHVHKKNRVHKKIAYITNTYAHIFRDTKPFLSKLN